MLDSTNINMSSSNSKNYLEVFKSQQLRKLQASLHCIQNFALCCLMQGHPILLRIVPQFTAFVVGLCAGPFSWGPAPGGKGACIRPGLANVETLATSDKKEQTTLRKAIKARIVRHLLVDVSDKLSRVLKNVNEHPNVRHEAPDALSYIAG
ncbi:hypothetical protein Tco_0977828 [Tanacetum coccineum]|uniref:Uncharacterized protein n=1 Tax=Tanacetum coccineum TaxID=301880 RepID=A0ABQ5EL81_9ASTR